MKPMILPLVCLLLSLPTPSVWATEQETEALPLQTEGPRMAADQARGFSRAAGIETQEVLLVLPRMLASVPRVAMRTAFYPLQLLSSAMDRYAIVEHTEDLLYNDARTAAIFPYAMYQSVFGYTVGLNAFHDDLFGHQESIKAKARYGGLYFQGYQLSFEADRLGGSRFWLEARARYEKNPRLIFRGIGDEGVVPENGILARPTDAAASTRYNQERVLALMRLGYTGGQAGRLVKTGLTAIFNHRVFGPSEHGSDSDVSIETVYDTAQLTGFEPGVDLLELQWNLVLDFRNREARPSSGVYFEAFVGGAPPQGDFQYAHYGLEGTVFIDLFRGSRVLVLRAALEGIYGDDQEIPFSELSRLGGPHRLRGYILERFRDKLSAMATAEYRYPVHEYVAGHLFVDLGRVAKDFDRLFSDRAWRVGYGGGIIVGTLDSQYLKFDLSYGDDGFQFFVSTDPLAAFTDRSKQL